MLQTAQYSQPQLIKSQNQKNKKNNYKLSCVVRRVKTHVFLLVLTDHGALAIPDDVRLVVLIEIHGEV
jgi:hypothetical protein